MKKIVSLVILMFVFTNFVNAQINFKKLETEAEGDLTGTEISSLLTGIESNIKPSSQTTSFAATKSSWLSSASKAVNASEGASLLSQFVSGLKSTTFSSGWAAIKDKWFASAKTTSTNDQLKSLTSQLVSNISPTSLSSSKSAQALTDLISAIK